MSEETTTASLQGVRFALAGLLLAALSGCHREESATERLLALAPRSERPIEARLTGFDWQSMRRQRSTQAGLMDPARLELAGAASAVIQSRSGDSSAHARQECGAAYLLIDRDRDAVDALESSVQQSPRNAGGWSDLSAARYTLAVREKRPHLLPQALADADHALTIAPKLPDALFNRALIIEAFGITEAARRAWQRYLVVDPSSHWSNEATAHLGRLPVVPTGDEFRRQLASAVAAYHRGDHAPITALARNSPQEARTWSDVILLAKWADAIRAGKTTTAGETLSVVRELGSTLAAFNHDQSTTDAVAEIDRNARNPLRIEQLAAAYTAYHDGRLLYRDRRIADAQVHLRQAAKLFAPDGGPMSIATDYYLASCSYDSTGPVKASQTLDWLITRVDSKRYPGLVAEIAWERSLCHASSGQWDAAIRSASEARRVFASLGETEYRAEMDNILAGDLNHSSQPAAAWKSRIAAFPVLSRAGSSDRIRNSLLSEINVEAAQGKFEVALALSGVAVDDLHSSQPVTIALTEADRAEALANLGDTGAAKRAIERARRSAKAVPDVELRRRTSAGINLAEAVVVRNADPNRSLQLLDAAVTFYTSDHGNLWLPRAFLERGRTQVRAKNDSAALADFKAGLQEVNIQRSSIASSESRGTFYDTEPELFSETIDLLIRKGDIERAFEFSDTARALTLYERASWGKTPNVTTAEQLRKGLPPRTVLIEYAVLHKSIAIFYFSSAGSGLVQIATTPAAVRALVERCGDLLQHRGDLAEVRQVTTALHQLLLAPVAAQIAGADTLIIVPERQLHTVPFAALYDPARGRYVVEDFAVSVALSAGHVLLPRSPRMLTPVLIVGDPHDEDESSLPDAAREASAIAAMYDSPTLLSGEQATSARFIAAAQRSGLIHYAGHAQSDAADPFGSLHFASSGNNEAPDLDANAISALHLRNAPLVVLAACGTIRGDSEHVEGMPSIARAFLAAGARNVVGTLWEVDDDAVAPLFRRLHRELRAGRQTPVALRIAQAAFAHDPDPRRSHPATWAPVELLGYSNEQTPTEKKRSE